MSQTPAQKSNNTALGIGTLIMVLFAFALFKGPGAPREREPVEARVSPVVPAPTPLPEVKIYELHAAYENNEVSADNTFKGKKFRIYTSVVSIGKDILGTPYLMLSDNVQASLPDGAAFASRLNKRDEVKLVCEGRGKLISIQLRCWPE